MRGIGFKSGGYHSSTGWEKSHFGGHQRLIWDYPYINTPDTLSMTPGNAECDLPQYSASKLLKIFFMAAKDQELAEQLFDQKTAEVVEVKTGYAWNAKVEPKIKLTATTESLKKAMPIICGASTELAPLFDEFKSFIISSKYEILLDIPEGMGQEGESGEGEGEEGKEGKEGEGKEGKGEGEGKEGKGKSGKGKGEGEKSEGDPKDGEGGGKHKPGSDRGGKGGGHNVSGPESGTVEDAKTKIDKMSPAERVKLAKQLISEIGKEIIEKMVKAIIEEAKKGYSYSGSSGVTGMSTGCEVKPHFTSIKPATELTKMYQFEKQNAEMLLKMLDISWDSDSDIVKSLRMGKIDLSKIAEVPAGNVAIYQRELEDQATKPFSVCILVDESGSMGRTRPDERTEWQWNEDTGEEYRGMSRGTSAYHLVKSLYHAFSQILPQDKLYIYGHTTGGPTGAQVFNYHDAYAPNFLKTVDDMIVRSKGSNYDGPVVEAVHQKVRSITDDRIIFLVLSDGQPAAPGYGGPKDIKDFQRIIERAKRDEFVTCGIFMQYAGNKNMYNYSTQINDMNEMPKKVSHLLNKVVKTEFQ